MIYAYKKIGEKFKDSAGKWRAKVFIADTEAIFVKFDHEPTINEIKIEVAKYIEILSKQKSNELKIVTEQIEELKVRKVILEQEISEPQV